MHMQRLNYLKESTAEAGETKDGDNAAEASFARGGTAGGESKQEGEALDNKAISAEALQKEEDEFAKLEALFIAELELKSEDLPDYAKGMGIDLAAGGEEAKGGKKGR
jgi:hypothetical protein